MLDPELPDPLVGMGERETAGRLGVGKAGGIEIEPHSPLLRPLDPGLEVGRFNLVAINLLPGKLAIEGMQVEPVAAGDEGEGHIEIGPQFIRRAGLARIIARHGQSAAEFLARMLKAADIVPLPAMERNGDLGEAAQRLLHAHAVGRVEFLGQLECGRHLLCCGCHGRILPARVERGINAPEVTGRQLALPERWRQHAIETFSRLRGRRHPGHDAQGAAAAAGDLHRQGHHKGPFVWQLRQIGNILEDRNLPATQCDMRSEMG